MKIILDAMGGDLAPDAIVQGAVDAAKEFGVEITLVGRGEAILQSLKKLGMDTLPTGMEIANAEDVVDMHDDPSKVMHQRKDSSMLVALRMLAEGKGDAMISAGSTGALLTAATLIVKRIKGIRRAAFAPVIPTKGGSAVLTDCGANAECTPEFLLQFAYMGSFCASCFEGKENPRVGLLNIGAEDSKGTDLQRAAYALLSEAAGINFVGNVEAREAMEGAVDVIVTDGFSGNVMLKTVEGTALFLASEMKKMFTKSLATKIGALLCKAGIADFKKLLDYRETGGTLMLGLTKPVIKAHGSSDARAVRSAVRQAIQAVESGVTETIAQNIDKMVVPKERPQC
jgi:glycerol-3-phosphate acyltransferase PlsX